MSKGEKIILGVLIAALAFGAALWKRQADIQHRQQELNRKIERSPFIEPATTNSTQTTPQK